ncbi:hypothetical protein JRQ81_007534 [Phrynocephalus forsythii]|uniref:Uncharacterized protein n=1 Tax=Phrynocephalus forsythii TaxID=171643 RepID=A0A9Q0Y631_9SAUR|nr:hypothetical protein JRQ81_007534 [Phrynocephalus forsythii]
MASVSGIQGFNLAIEKVLSSLLCSLFGLLRCASIIGLHLEAGFTSLECSAWSFEFHFWLKVFYIHPAREYLHHIKEDIFTSSWHKSFVDKLHLLGFSIDFLSRPN